MTDPRDDITREEALAAMKDPEKGSLRVLKALGKLRDAYSRELAAGGKRLIVRTPLEEVAAEQAILDHRENLLSFGEEVPDDLTLFRAGAVPEPAAAPAAGLVSGPGIGSPFSPVPPPAKAPAASPDAPVTKEEVLAALEDPEKGSLRVLKALGKQRDLYSRELLSGKTSLLAKNPFEEACAEAAIKDFREALESEGEDVPEGLRVEKDGFF